MSVPSMVIPPCSAARKVSRPARTVDVQCPEAPEAGIQHDRDGQHAERGADDGRADPGPGRGQPQRSPRGVGHDPPPPGLRVTPDRRAGRLSGRRRGGHRSRLANRATDLPQTRRGRARQCRARPAIRVRALLGGAADVRDLAQRAGHLPPVGLQRISDSTVPARMKQQTGQYEPKPRPTSTPNALASTPWHSGVTSSASAGRSDRQRLGTESRRDRELHLRGEQRRQRRHDGASHRARRSCEPAEEAVPRALERRSEPAARRSHAW